MIENFLPLLEKISPAIITILGNLIFYLWIKGKVDKSLEKNKIAYGGIFKEKVNIYRELLERTYGLKKELSRFQYVGVKEDGTVIMEKINDYIQFASINQPFLSKEMLSDVNTLRTEFQDVFDNFYKHIANSDSTQLNNFFQAGNKLRANEPFKEIEDRIVTEMRRDLKIENFDA
ncbi:hypothetical protein DFQ03_1675 [Maribacter caenipelagi]|uniref:Uncharacterized protein n=1 Tax=Maribacter caenipelagi TaxID=1447781 RepID=A0A4R7D234_9FLAO|nr:hypothetical protein [Maribacter caenipelagi]TDS15039.1 hypothetical protein DFQ03_1675 [Maribacter caenipelagi]